MIPKLINTQRATIRLIKRHFASQITPASSQVPTPAEATLPQDGVINSSDYTTEGYLAYFESGASVVDLATLKDNIRTSNFEFFLAIPNFLKVADALEKYSSSLPDGLEKDGAVQFKKQLYALYQARSRSVSEHDAFTREIESHELPHLIESSQQELIAERQQAKTKLKGAVVKNATTYAKFQKLGFALANLSTSFGIFLYFPYITAMVGHGVPSFVAALTAINGMFYIVERNNTVDELRFVQDQNGKQRAQITICQSMIKPNLIVEVPLSSIEILSIEDDRPARLQITMPAKELYHQIGSARLQEAKMLDIVQQSLVTGSSIKLEGLSHEEMELKQLDSNIQFVLTIPKESVIDTAMIALLSHPSLAEDTEFVQLFEKRVSSLTFQAQVLSKPIDGVKVQKLLESYGEAHLDKIDDHQLLRLYSSQ